jgi:TonB family protein
MNIKYFSNNKVKRFYLFPFFLTFILASLTISAQTTQLSLVDIFTALRSNKATLVEKNNILAEGIKQRGITFAIDSNLEKELRKAGANDDLIQAIHQKNPAPKPKVEPKVEPTPKPISTPTPPDFSYYQNRANSNFVLGDYDSAIKDYTEAIKLNAKESSIYLSRGLAYYNKRKFSPAVADFDKAIELDADESMAFYNRGNALKEIGELEKALADYKSAAALDSDNDLAKGAFEKLQAELKPKQIPQNIERVKPNPNTKNTEQAAKQTPNKGKAEQSRNNKKTEQTAKQTDSNEPVSIGLLQNLAVKLAIPIYPPMERSMKIVGLVTVEVTINKDGKVISAKAINGPKGLRRPSEIATRNSTFKPYMVDNNPVNATGFITYNFKM